ncbi:MAG: ribonuclease III [Alphaproteobacteria bacterium]|nr:ribonuclease III [Alphaproteobacteria bacterium]MCL2506035.1 ribonuclease III [Alphaproteobacteria bacterium]
MFSDEDSEFAKNLEYEFKDAGLLNAALTHPSLTIRRCAGKKKPACPYERLEFLGDRVLGVVIAKALYERFPSAAEGELAIRLSSLVKAETLKHIALDLKLDFALKVDMSLGEVRQHSSALPDAMEAVIGAMFLDAGLEVPERFILKHWKEYFNAETESDPKSVLQEIVQKRKLPIPSYVIIENSGPPHLPIFIIEVQVKGLPHCQGTGRSKREAEKAAAAALLGIMNQDDKK